MTKPRVLLRMAVELEMYGMCSCGHLMAEHDEITCSCGCDAEAHGERGCTTCRTCEGYNACPQCECAAADLYAGPDSTGEEM